MILSLIVALDRNGLIGREGALPWHLPADLKHFKAVTMGKPIIMGRKTFASIGRPLPGRRNIILSRQSGLTVYGCEVYSSAEAVLSALGANGDIDEIEAMVIGGAEVYREFMPHVRRMYVTVVDGLFEGDTWFPGWPLGTGWVERSCRHHPADDKNGQAMDFFVFEKLEKV